MRLRRSRRSLSLQNFFCSECVDKTPDDAGCVVNEHGAGADTQPFPSVTDHGFVIDASIRDVARPQVPLQVRCLRKALVLLALPIALPLLLLVLFVTLGRILVGLLREAATAVPMPVLDATAAEDLPEGHHTTAFQRRSHRPSQAQPMPTRPTRSLHAMALVLALLLFGVATGSFRQASAGSGLPQPSELLARGCQACSRDPTPAHNLAFMTSCPGARLRTGLSASSIRSALECFDASVPAATLF